MSEKANETAAARTASAPAGAPVSAPINVRKTLTRRQRLARVGVVVAVVMLLPYRLRVAGECAIVSSVATDAVAPADGIVHDIAVKEGDRLKAGAPIASLVAKDTAAPVGQVASPIDGVVATPNHALQARVGSWVHAGDAVAMVLDRAKLIVRVDVSQREVSDTKLGQLAAVKLQGYPSHTLQGRVTRISESTRASRGDVIVPVEVTLDEVPDWVRPGMRGWTKLGGDVTVIGALIARRLARSLWIELWSLF